MKKQYISLRNKEISRDREIEWEERLREIEWEERLNDHIDTFIKRSTEIQTEMNICKANLVNGNYEMALKYLRTVMNKFDKAFVESSNLYNLLDASKNIIEPVAADEIKGQLSIIDFPEVM